MIFISHTYKDKSIVEPISLKLSKIYGKENVFYDSWSIQPGDGIIERMNEGLENCKFFFFFVSNNSLQSKMVTLEWQNALLKKTNGDIKFIPVKLDACMMPAILMQSLYIDIFGKGLEVGIRQMIDVINGKNVYRADIQTFENVIGHIKNLSASECVIEFKARYYLEPISKYAIVLDNSLDDLSIESDTDRVRQTIQKSNFKFPDGSRHNILLESVSRGTTPQFPYRVKLATKSGNKLKIVNLMKATDEIYYNNIPYYYEDNN